jgi:hypothetical protein
MEKFRSEKGKKYERKMNERKNQTTKQLSGQI